MISRHSLMELLFVDLLLQAGSSSGKRLFVGIAEYTPEAVKGIRQDTTIGVPKMFDDYYYAQTIDKLG